MKKKLALLALLCILLRLWVLAGGADALTARLVVPADAQALSSGVGAEAESTPPVADESGGDGAGDHSGGDGNEAAGIGDAEAENIGDGAENGKDEVGSGESEAGESGGEAENPFDPEAEVLPTTIPGGMTIRNNTSYLPDMQSLLARSENLTLPASGVQILIVHTHGSEAYTPDAVDRYVASDVYRTEDERYNVIRVGDELARELEKFGLTVHHDRNIYDYPSYTGSYTRSGEAVTAHLAAHPETAIVIDLHRDALGTNDVVYKTVATLEGESSSQLMFVVGTDESGLAHPGWEDNLALALKLQQAVSARYPTLARPILLVRERYNQHLTPGSLILEVGSSGNSLQEALSAVRLFAAAVGPVMREMMG